MPPSARSAASFSMRAKKSLTVSPFWMGAAAADANPASRSDMVKGRTRIGTLSLLGLWRRRRWDHGCLAGRTASDLQDQLAADRLPEHREVFGHHVERAGT